MKLTYRGISYELTSPVINVSEGAVIGAYRGAVVRAKHNTISPVRQLRLNLKYRGANYRPVVEYSVNPDINPDLASAF
ncbi:MAG: DUF4278 domain-containing protein [Cyanobacteria bacterium CRU_2_1]|nr:DUF4278 domain-containing protein [Cyanobacteria bacterium RU_5_0]NJR58967.1 DUF4278 domain-containing protein [Cyanobacteria bacterium CRU_2_1]